MDEKRKEMRRQALCDLMDDPAYVPMKEKELAVLLQVAKEDRAALSEILQELLAEGKLTVTARGKYCRAEENVLVGTFISNAKGFGFVEVEGRKEDLFIPENCTNGAFHLDTVQAALLPGGRGKRREAQIVRILKRGMSHVVGTYERSRGGFGFVSPDNVKLPWEIYVPKEASMGAVDGHKVVVELTDYGTDFKSPEGRVVEILGHENDPGVDILSIVRGFELPSEFSQEVLSKALKAARPVEETSLAGRKDLRDVCMVTIDGEDAKDLDDAVSLDFDGLQYHLGVHIADVSEYVREGSALDREALKRGTSVYLVDRVIPMLPHVLSNGICSLNQGEDRLALSCLMDIDLQGEIVDYSICESVIRVDRRMTYGAVQALLEDGSLAEREEIYRPYREFLPMFRNMESLAALLRRKRRKRGSIDFDFPECKISLDREGRPLKISAYERNTATDIIEDFMLAANETVAQHFYWLEAPFVYRVHDLPDAERIQKLTAFLAQFGYSLKAAGRRKAKVDVKEVHPKEIQKLLAKVAGTPQEGLISRLALRSMKQAKYSVENSGHFGLACGYYCHFTSPIRRYPDLQIHRIIKEQLRGELTAQRAEHYRAILPEVAKKSSEAERRAGEAERETEKLKKVEYMEGHLGETFEGVVSGVTAWGVYVELPDTVEGLIHVSRLPGDYYVFHENTYEMVGESTGRTFRLGMPLTVRVEDCDRVQKTIDFSLVQGGV